MTIQWQSIADTTSSLGIVIDVLNFCRLVRVVYAGRQFGKMNRYLFRRTLIATGLVLAAAVAISFALKTARSRNTESLVLNSRGQHIPKTVLWAWERPTDLRFINPHEDGIAFLPRTIRLAGDDVIVRPRLQSMDVPDGSTVIAVARIETDRSNKASLSQNQAEQLTRTLSELAALPNISAIQIDFDATRSEREFYRNVIVALRSRLPNQIGLSITALASWCDDDDWISDLPIDEAVPMLFRMGPDRDHARNLVASGEQFAAAPCRGSYGVSTDEPIADLDRSKRIYVFNPESWTEQSVRAILESK
jgi:hypothetical protein